MNRQEIEIEIGEIVLTAPPAMLRRLAAALEQELAQIVAAELERRISAHGPEWRPVHGGANAIERTVGPQDLTGAAIGLVVADTVWGGLSQ